jgi:hypothetical protein
VSKCNAIVFDILGTIYKFSYLSANTIRSLSENVGRDKKSKRATVPLREAPYTCSAARDG